MKKSRLLAQRAVGSVRHGYRVVGGCGVRQARAVSLGCCPFRSCLPWLLLALLCPNPAVASHGRIDDFGKGTPERFAELVRPVGVGLGSGQQLQQIRSYCAGLNMSDFVCRRIERIIFVTKAHDRGDNGTLWDNNHRPTGAVSRDWGDPRMVASHHTGGETYSCMSLRFDPPIPRGWGLSFFWTVGQRYCCGDSTIGEDRGTAVTLKIGSTTARNSNIQIGNETDGRVETIYRDNFRPWQKVFKTNLAQTSEVRWCFFSGSARDHTHSRARLDGVAFGASSETFSRPADNNFIDRYCDALDLTDVNCKQVSQLVFTRRATGEHVWDPTHSAGSQSGSAPSVLSSPARKDSYSCMSVLLDPPHPAGRPMRFAWDVSRRAGYSGESGRVDAVLRFYYFAPGGGAGHAPIDSDGRAASSRAFRSVRTSDSGFGGWAVQTVDSDPSEPAGVGELKWCYFGGNPIEGQDDRGRLERLSFDTPLLLPQDYANGRPTDDASLDRPAGAGIFSGTQDADIQAYCDGLDISDYNCRRISKIRFFAEALPSGVSAPWDNNHQSVPFGDSEPPYDELWGDSRMVASPAICTPGTSPGVCAERFAGFSSYSCMALVFDPPIPAGWDLEYRWTVGARHDARGSQVGGTAVDIRLGAATQPNSDIQLSDVEGQSRQNIATSSFLPWQYRSTTNLDSPVPEIRWCFFSSAIRQSARDLARIDGVLFGTDAGERFCRPELNPRGRGCLSEHDDFIDRYCAALDIIANDCAQVREIAFSRTGVGEHVWDPTHDQASSPGGGSSSVLSPPVRAGEYSCMSLHLATPNPAGAEFSFHWDMGRRASVAGETGHVTAYMRFYYFATRKGLRHDPLDSTRGSDASMLYEELGGGFGGWTPALLTPATEAEEFKWCYFGGYTAAGDQDRGRIDRLRTEGVPIPRGSFANGPPQRTGGLDRPAGVGLFSSAAQSRSIRDYCDGLNISDYNCRRISRVAFFARDLPTGTSLPWDNDHRLVASGDLDPPHDDSWGDSRMVASPGIDPVDDDSAGFSSYSCMSLFLDPPIPSGWGLEFRWTVGARHDENDGETRATAVDVEFGAETGDGTDLVLTDGADQFRRNTRDDGFLPWQYRGFTDFDRAVTEVRWCFFSSNILGAERNLARIDGVLFGTDGGEEFCRPELNTDDDDCLPEHNNFIDRYCIALDVSDDNCVFVSRLGFSRTGVGEHVWDPTHAEASAEGGSSSVLSPPVRADEHSCMSLYFNPPIPQGEGFDFAWDLSRRKNDDGGGNNFLASFFFARGAGDNHSPEDFLRRDQVDDTFRMLAVTESGFNGWETQDIDDPDTEVGELKWCYFGGNPAVGEQDRGRIDRLRVPLSSLLLDRYASGIPQQAETLDRPDGVGLLGSTTQSRSIRDYCDGLNISDYNCRRISRIGFFARELPTAASLLWDNDHSMVASGDLDPPYDERWGEPRMVASPAINADSSSYSCLALVFDPPLPSGWDMEFRWTVGARHDDGDSQVRGTAVDVRLGAATQSDSSIRLTEDKDRSRQITRTDGFLPWQYRSITDFDSPVPEVRWCFFSRDVLAAERNLARIDGVLFGTDEGEEFCRPELNANDNDCLPEHDEFIDRYCAALDLSDNNCTHVSRLAFSRTGVGEHVWDPTHAAASNLGRNSSVLSPPVRAGEYSCMSLYFDIPNPQGENFDFAWGISRRGELDGETGREKAFLRFYFFAPGAGTAHDPLNFDARSSDDFRDLGPTSAGGFRNWTNAFIKEPKTEAEELKWCYFGGYSVAGAEDRGRIDRLRVAELIVSEVDARPEIEEYCTALNMSPGYCQRLSRMIFRDGGRGSRTVSRWSVSEAGSESGGGGASVVSRPVGDGDYHCMSLHFNEPIARGSDISFQWSLGLGADGGSSMMWAWFAPINTDRPSMPAPGQPSISRMQAGFSPWMEHSAVAIDRPVPEIRWCYLGAAPSAGEQDIGRVDRLLVGEGIALDFALPVPNPGPTVVEGTVTSIRLRSQIPLAAGQETTIRLIVEEGGHFLDPNSPPVVNSTMPLVADPALSDRLVLEFAIMGDGEAKEYLMELPTHDDDRIDGDGNILLSFAEPPPDAEYRVGTADRGYLIAVEDNEQPLILDAEMLLLWWQLVAQCTADGSGDCFQPRGAAPSLENRPDLPDRTQPQLAALAATFQELVDAGLLDFNADGRHDTLDLRLFLRYLAGLRGEALGSEPNTGTLSALAR